MAKCGRNCASGGVAVSCSACSSRARSRTDRSGLFLALGLAGGMLGGLALAKKLASTAPVEPKAPDLDLWQRELAKTRGTVAAGALCGKIHAQFANLYLGRPHFANLMLRNHLEKNILPGLALYQVLCEDQHDNMQALAEFDRLEEASILASPRAAQGKLLSMVPDPFAVFRLVHNRILDKQFPPEGWRFEWVEDSPEVIAYNCTDCFYHNVLTLYGAPELTAHFCRLDDVMFGRFPYFAWKRTTTIGRGDACCNFRFEKN